MDQEILKDNLDTNKGKEVDSMANIIAIQKDENIKRAEKISAALYLMSNFLNDEEPIKWDIRKLSTTLIKNISELSFSDTSDRELKLHKTNTTISELSSMIEIASLASLVSKMNAEILAKELGILASTASRGRNNLNKLSPVKITRNFFDFENKNEYEANDTTQNRALNMPKQKRAAIKDKSQTRPNFPITSTHYLPDVSEIGKAKIKEYGSVAVKRNKRQSFIIQVLKKKKDLTIKDISTIFHDCSEKTIQRELSILVDDGVVIKDGERRWTRYSLAIGA